MKTNARILGMTLSGVLALAAGCGKNEPTAPTSSAPNQSVATPNPEPPNAAETPAAPATNTPAPVANAAAPVANPAVKPSDLAGTTLKETAPVMTATANVATNLATNQPAGAGAGASTGLAALSQDQMARGLEDALAKGLQQAVAGLGHDGGFLTNLNVKIPMPEKLQKVEAAARAMKQDKLADDFIATMNHAAEQAVPQAASVFADALKQMTIDDARAILTGPNDAATQYFQKTTQTNLYAKFYPIVQKATANTGVTAAYKNLVDKAGVTKSLGSFGSALTGSLLDKDSLNVDDYVTRKALDGLFKMVAAEEQQIRQNPVARTTQALQTVFGALKK